MESLPEGHTCIYALVEPGTDAIRYVGKTRKPGTRLNQHRTLTQYVSPEKQAWIRELRAQKKRPQMRVLEIVPDEESTIRERFWIQQIWNEGHALLNQIDSPRPPSPCVSQLTGLPALNILDAARFLGVSRSQICEAILRGDLKPEQTIPNTVLSVAEVESYRERERERAAIAAAEPDAEIDNDAILTIQQVADKLGVSRAAVFQALSAGKLPSVTVLGRRGIRPQDVALYSPRSYRDRIGAKPKGRQPRKVSAEPPDPPKKRGRPKKVKEATAG